MAALEERPFRPRGAFLRNLRHNKAIILIKIEMLFKRSASAKRSITMNPIDFLAQYYDLRSKAFKILLEHGKQVAKRPGLPPKWFPG